MKERVRSSDNKNATGSDVIDADYRATDKINAMSLLG
jgi:hypothetical protein